MFAGGGGGVVAEISLTKIMGDFAGLPTLSKNVTTSIHWRQKHLTKVWGAWPPCWPPWLRHCTGLPGTL